MNSHDLTLFALGGTAGAYTALLVGLLLSLWDDHRKARANLATIPAPPDTRTTHPRKGPDAQEPPRSGQNPPREPRQGREGRRSQAQQPAQAWQLTHPRRQPAPA